jgi:hypothetical protein
LTLCRFSAACSAPGASFSVSMVARIAVHRLRMRRSNRYSASPARLVLFGKNLP